MTTKLSTRGRITLPKALREHLGWNLGIELEIEVCGKAVVLRRVSEVPETNLEDLFGCADYRGPARSLAEMEAGIAQGTARGRVVDSPASP